MHNSICILFNAHNSLNYTQPQWWQIQFLFFSLHENWFPLSLFERKKVLLNSVNIIAVKRADLHLYNIEEKSYCHHFEIYMQTKDIPLKRAHPTPAYKSNPPCIHSRHYPFSYTFVVYSLSQTERVKCGAVSVFVSVFKLQLEIIIALNIVL